MGRDIEFLSSIVVSSPVSDTKFIMILMHEHCVGAMVLVLPCYYGLASAFRICLL
jgi:hypothetical protein